MKGSDRRALVGVGLAIAAAMAFVYGPCLTGDFVNWDDGRFIYANPLFAEGGWAYVEAALTQTQFEAYQPVHLLSYLPDRYLWPSSAPGFRAIDLGLFGAAALVLFTLVRRRTSLPASALATLLFVCHPLCVEPAAWITSRKDVLSLLLALIVLNLEDTDSPSRQRHFGAVALFVAALLTKTATVVLPAVLVAWLVYLRGLEWRPALRRAAPFALVALAAGLETTLQWRSHGLIIERPAPVLLDIPGTLGFYLVKMVAPINTAAMYPKIPAGFTAMAVLAVITAGALVWRFPRLPANVRFAAIAAIASLAPVSNIAPLMFRFADRYALLALTFSTFAVATAIDWLAKRELRVARAGLAGVVVVIVIFAGLARAQAGAWTSSLALWRDVTRDQPTSYMGHLKLAETLREQGSFRDAAAEYQAAVALDGERPLAYAGLFYLYAREAEDRGMVSKGSADRWLAALGPALRAPDALVSLRNETLAGGCRRCALMAELVHLKRVPQSDAVLLDKAAAAIDSGMRDFAAIYLDAVVDRSAPRARELEGRLGTRP